MVVPPQNTPKLLFLVGKQWLLGTPILGNPHFTSFFLEGNKGISLPQLPFGGPRSRFRSRANLTRSIKR